jgi:hypothetical protein
MLKKYLPAFLAGVFVAPAVVLMALEVATAPSAKFQYSAPRASTSGVVRGLTVNNGLVQAVNFGPVKSTDLEFAGLNAATYGDGSHVPQITIDAAGRLSNFLAMPMVVRDTGGQVFNVKADKYGIVGDNNHDDTAGIQAAINDAIAAGAGTVVLPSIPNYSKITSTISIAQAQGQTYSTLNIVAQGGSVGNGQRSYFNYTGPSNSSVFTIADGFTTCLFQGVGVNVGNGQTSVIVWDIPGGSNIGYLRYNQCPLVFGTNTSNCIGWRLGQNLSTGQSNIYGTVWNQCAGNGGNSAKGNIFIQIGGSEAYASKCHDCSMEGFSIGICNGPIISYLQNAILASDTTLTIGAGSGTAGNHLAPGTASSANTTVMFPSSGVVQIGSEQIAYASKNGTQLTGCTRGYNGTTAAAAGAGSSVIQYVAGQGAYGGAAGFCFEGGGGGGNIQDFYFSQTGGWFSVKDARFEGQAQPANRFISLTPFGSSNGMQHIDVENVFLVVYTPPPDNHGLVWLVNNCNFTLKGSHVTTTASTQFGSSNPFISNYNGVGGGSITIERTALQAATPFWSYSNVWPTALDAVQLIAGDGVTFNSTITQKWIPPATLTDAATVNLDFSINPCQVLPMTGAIGTNRAITFSNLAPGQKVRLILQQPASGGPCNVNSWPAVVRWQGGSIPAQTQTAGKWDAIDFFAEATGAILGTPTSNY